MSEQKPLWNQFLEWLSGLFPKSSVEASGETPDKPSNPTPTTTGEKEEFVGSKPYERPPTRRIDPRTRGLESQ